MTVCLLNKLRAEALKQRFYQLKGKTMSTETIDLTQYKEDMRGNLVPVANIKEIDLLRDDVVNGLMKKALVLREQMQLFKANTQQDLADFIEISASRYDIKLGGKKGNITLHSFDGKYKIQLSIAEHIRFDEGILSAQALIMNCLERWTDGANSDLKTLIHQAFETDKEGRLSAYKILGLRRVQIKDEQWQKAMQAIGEAVLVVGSKSYIRFYERQENGDYQAVSLDLAGI